MEELTKEEKMAAFMALAMLADFEREQKQFLKGKVEDVDLVLQHKLEVINSVMKKTGVV